MSESSQSKSNSSGAEVSKPLLPSDSLAHMVREAGPGLREINSPKADFPTGISIIDESLNGGVHGITVLAGRSGVGKTAFMSQVAVQAVRKSTDTLVLIYSLDMSKHEFGSRILVAAQNPGGKDSDTGANPLTEGQSQRIVLKDCFWSVRTVERSKNEKQRAYMACIVRDKPFTLSNGVKWTRKNLPPILPSYDENGGPQTFANTYFPQKQLRVPQLAHDSIAKDVSEYKKANPVRNVLVMIDLLQDVKCDAESSNKRDEAVLQLVKDNERKLQKAHPDGQISFLISTAVRKTSGSSKKNNTILLDDLLGSTQLAYSADIVLGLNFESKVSESLNQMTLEILKGRQGVKRDSHSIEFEHPSGYFRGQTVGNAVASKQKTVRKRRPSRNHMQQP